MSRLGQNPNFNQQICCRAPLKAFDKMLQYLIGFNSICMSCYNMVLGHLYFLAQMIKNMELGDVDLYSHVNELLRVLLAH